MRRATRSVVGAGRRWWTSILRQLPRGNTLDDDVWRVRHRTLTRLLIAHVPAILLYGVVRGAGLGHSAVEVVVLAAFAAAAMWIDDRAVASASTALGLVACSAVLVHMSGGLIETHFHFFVVVTLLALYQDWLPFLLAVGFVFAHHSVLGSVAPLEVYNHQAAEAHPLRWAAIHGVFLLASATASVVAWRFSEQHALQDSVTRLPNRRLFHERASHALARLDRDGAVAVLYIDLDRFKEVNDTAGHAVGDRLLALAAERMSSVTRRGDTVARIGGDEFAVLVEDLTGDADASLLAQRLVATLADPFVLPVGSFCVGASVGIAISRSGVTVDELLMDADSAMYMAKAAGRGCFERFDAGTTHRPGRGSTEVVASSANRVALMAGVPLRHA